MASTRYDTMFARLAQHQEGAFVPFLVLGDPTVEISASLLQALVEGGADALELGIAFSDPIADGPTIQGAVVRALEHGMKPAMAWDLIRGIRSQYPDLPIGLLVYANLVFNRGVDTFYREALQAGVDSVLVADVPVLEAEPFVAACRAAGLESILIVPPNASDATLTQVARLSTGYTYVLGRAGVTGAGQDAALPSVATLQRLTALGAAPSLIGFGISKPEHVRAALAAGATGAISGSAVVDRVTRNIGDTPTMLADVTQFVRDMKAATRA